MLASLTRIPDELDLHLLIRVVSVSEKGHLTLPAREIWAGRDEDGSTVYEIFYARSLEDTDSEEVTLEQVNEELHDHKWLRSLEPWGALSAGCDLSHVTQVVRGNASFWKETKDEHGQRYYEIDEPALMAWINNGAGDADVDDDESNWAQPDPVDKPLWYGDEQVEDEDRYARDDDSAADAYPNFYSIATPEPDEGGMACQECSELYPGQYLAQSTSYNDDYDYEDDDYADDGCKDDENGEDYYDGAVQQCEQPHGADVGYDGDSEIW